MRKRNKYVMIVATDMANGLGKNNDLPWHISEDLKRFKKITTGHTILMGRKTWESLPKKPLPERDNVVLTRNENYKAEGATVIHSMDEIKNVVKANEEVYIIGGAEIYAMFLPYVSTVHLTLVKDRFECDTFFTEFDRFKFKTLNETNIRKDEKSGIEYQYITLEKRE